MSMTCRHRYLIVTKEPLRTRVQVGRPQHGIAASRVVTFEQVVRETCRDCGTLVRERTVTEEPERFVATAIAPAVPYTQDWRYGPEGDR